MVYINRKQSELETYEEWRAEESNAFPIEQTAYEEWIDQRSLIHIIKTYGFYALYYRV